MFNMFENIMRNLFSRPATRKYPYQKRDPYKNARGQISGVDIDSCVFCGICGRKCPSDAITVNKDKKTWEIDNFKCIVCGICSEACPKKCLFMDERHKTSAYVKEKLRFIKKEGG